MLAAQPAQQPVATAAAQSATLTRTDDSKEKSALLQSLSGDAKSLLSVEDKTADHKTAVTDSKSAVSTQAASSKNSNPSDFNSALAAMTAAVSTTVQPESQQKSTDSSNLMQTLAQVNSAAMAAPATAVSSTPTTTSLVTAPTVPQLNAQLGSPEWQQQLGQQVMMFNRQGVQSAELRLHPQDLGSIQISMKIEDGQAQMHFVSGHSAVRSAIEAAMPDLKTALADNGISLGQSSVGSDSSQWQQAQQQSSQSGSQQGNASSWAAFNADGVNSAADALPVPASIAQRISGSNSVDIFA